MSDQGGTHADFLAWYRENSLPRSYGRRRVTFIPNWCWVERKSSLSEHRGLAQGWPMVNPLGVTEPMVGWKQTPFSTITSRLLVLISVFILCALKWNNGWIPVYIYTYIYKWFFYWMIKLCVCIYLLVNLFFWLIIYMPQLSLQGVLGCKPIGGLG